MQLSVPYRRQERTFSCGPASLRMLCAFCGKRISERRLRIEARISPKTGVRRRELEVLGRHYIGACVRRCARWDHIREALIRGTPVLINFREPSEEVGHFALVIGTDGGEVILHDPWNGPGFRLPLQTFLDRWLHHPHSGSGGWMMELNG